MEVFSGRIIEQYEKTHSVQWWFKGLSTIYLGHTNLMWSSMKMTLVSCFAHYVKKDLEYRILKVFVRLVAKFCVWLFICIYIKYQNVKSYFLFFVDGKCFKWKLNKLRCHWYNLKKLFSYVYTLHPWHDPYRKLCMLVNCPSLILNLCSVSDIRKLFCLVIV